MCPRVVRRQLRQLPQRAANVAHGHLVGGGALVEAGDAVQPLFDADDRLVLQRQIVGRGLEDERCVAVGHVALFHVLAKLGDVAQHVLTIGSHLRAVLHRVDISTQVIRPVGEAADENDRQHDHRAEGKSGSRHGSSRLLSNFHPIISSVRYYYTTFLVICLYYIQEWL